MRFLFELFVARRFLLTGRREGLSNVVVVFSFLGILLGVAALIVVMAWMNGIRSDFVERILSYNGHIRIEAKDQPLKLSELGERSRNDRKASGVLGDLLAQPNVADIIPLIEDQVMISANGFTSGALARGISRVDLAHLEGFSQGFHWGALEDFSGWNLIISAAVARRMDVGIGQSLEVISPKGDVTPFGWSPRIKTFRIAGVVTLPQDRGLLFMPLDRAQIFFKLKESVNLIDIRTRDWRAIETTAGEIESLLPADWPVRNWRDYNRVLVEALDVERLVVAVILSFVVLIAAFSIVTGQIMLVREKTEAIAVLRAMGTQTRSILSIFFLAGGAIGLMGTLLGLALGWGIVAYYEPVLGFVMAFSPQALSLELAYIASVVPQTSPGHLFRVALFALALTFLAALIPALRAARLHPVEILRHE